MAGTKALAKEHRMEKNYEDAAAEVHDAIESLLAYERLPDGTYECLGIEVEISELERWKELLA